MGTGCYGCGRICKSAGSFFYKVYTGIVELKNELSAKYDEEEIEEKITKIQSDFLDIYNHKDNGDDENGDNKNMGN